MDEYPIGTDHEQAFIKSFVISAKKHRLFELFANPKRRRKALDELNHQKCLNPKYMSHIEPRCQEKSTIVSMLRSKGSPELVYVFSNDSDLDRKELALDEALERTVGLCGCDTVISCIAGELAYFEDEDIGERYILSRSLPRWSRSNVTPENRGLSRRCP